MVIFSITSPDIPYSNLSSVFPCPWPYAPHVSQNTASCGISSLLSEVDYNNRQNQLQLSCSGGINSLSCATDMNSEIGKKKDGEFAAPYSFQGVA
jgi:hypothetical protein